jgi:hypothetical protein
METLAILQAKIVVGENKFVRVHLTCSVEENKKEFLLSMR